MAGSTTVNTAADLQLVERESREKTVRRLPLLERMLAEQQDLSAVERFSQFHDDTTTPLQQQYYSRLMPLSPPAAGQQYAFEVDLDLCSGCKACVSACHRLNGLEPAETWRSVGMLHGGSAAEPVQKTVTTACHHCLDPACMNGCPVQAYEKDPLTGIVRHLDDQCIGCQYCMLTCPYEVPQFSKAKGIVRKCDMCSDRLAEGEAPACVQACPNAAIAIKVVNKADVLADAQVDAFLPGTPSPGITAPTTTYKTRQAFPRNMRPADFFAARTAHNHVPLVIMLVLSQLSVGAFAALWLPPVALYGPPMLQRLQTIQGLGALAVAIMALAASTAHVGRPLYGYRALLGLRTSWMSREILLMGLFVLAALLYGGLLLAKAVPVLGQVLQLVLPEPVSSALLLPLGWTVAGLGLLAVYTSVMLYHVTKRQWWHGGRTAARFYGTTVVLGLSATALFAFAEAHMAGADLDRVQLHFASQLGLAITLASVAKLAFELAVFLHLRDKQHGDLRRSAILLSGELGHLTRARFLLGVLGGVVAPQVLMHGVGPQNTLLALVSALLGLCALIAGELIERSTFFMALSSPRMPGGLR